MTGEPFDNGKHRRPERSYELFMDLKFAVSDLDDAFHDRGLSANLKAQRIQRCKERLETAYNAVYILVSTDVSALLANAPTQPRRPLKQK